MPNDLLGAGKRSTLLGRVKAILTRPAETWRRIAAEQEPSSTIFSRYFLPLAAIGPVAGFIGGQLGFFNIFGVTFRPSLLGGLFDAVASFAGIMVGAVVLSLVVAAVARKFDGEPTGNNAFKLVAYSATAGLVGGIFGLVPMLGIFGLLLGIYGIYLFYLGSGPMLNIPEAKRGGFTAVTFACTILLAIAISSVGSMLASPFRDGPLDVIDDGEVSGELAIPGVGSFDTDKLQEAAKEMEKAQNGEAVPVDPASLKALLPATIGSFARGSVETASINGIGNVEAPYRSGDQQFELRIVQMGGMGAFAGAMKLDVNHEDEDGYERVKTVDGSLTTEKWDKSGSGTYSETVGSRFMVEASGKVANIDVLKTAVAAVDESELEELGN